MRLLLVSCHYPPDFISGGTLLPQRLARGLHARGHEVSVYAGWLGDLAADPWSGPAGARPLEGWTEVDETGLPVRWVVSTPWIGWDLRENFDNPAVAADFAAHLARVQPDVVHFHSLQSLGAGLVAVAAESGAKVVVTMHDFWWWCGRQFLVDLEHRPCPMVVACGSCGCQVDRPWLEVRTAFLQAQLAQADAVLAVSQSAATVYLANGLDPAVLEVDENSLPPVDEAQGPRPGAAEAERPEADPSGPGATGARDDAPLRFRYAGGADRMKGVHVLLHAAGALADLPGWRLVAHGAGSYVQAEGVDLEGVPVELADPFPPDELDTLLAQTDVLVVPSVMRETYSLVTREALTRGVPVLVTDTLGPEEVVHDGVNGLVVPAGDADALAAAMRSLVLDRDKVGRMAEACGKVPVRSLDDQLDGLERRYRALLEPVPAEARTSVVPAVRDVRWVLFLVGITGAPLRYRVHLATEGLALLGVHSDVRHYRHPEVIDLVERVDAVVAYRVPATVQVLDLLERARNRGVPTFFDVDDLIFDPDIRHEIPAMNLLPPDEAELWMQGVRRYRTTMEACDAYIGSTEALCRAATDVVGLPAERFANGVGMVLARASDAERARPRADGPLRIGYLSGTTTHDADWAFVEPAVVRALDAHPDVEVWLGGPVAPTTALDRFGARVQRIPFTDWLRLPAILRDLDVNLAPLEPGSRFNEAKSAIKWLEAALTATPTVASPTQPFCEAIDHGVNGFLAESVDDWFELLDRLLADPVLRARTGARASRDALLRWSPHLQGRRYLDILQGGIPARRAGQFPPEALDEPYEAVPVDLYPLPASPLR